jgi:hypothetical protein
MVRGIEVVALHPGLRGRALVEGVTPLETGLALPFFPATFRGVAIGGAWPPALLDEFIRVLAPGGRIVLEVDPEDRDQRRADLEARTRDLLLVTDRVLVAVR